MNVNVESAGFIGLAIGFILGIAFLGLLLASRNPLDYGRSCNADGEVAILLSRPDGKMRQTACLKEWRVVHP